MSYTSKIVWTSIGVVVCIIIGALMFLDRIVGAFLKLF